jgi:MoxR-like ATPase
MATITDDRATCAICGTKAHYLAAHLTEAHGMTVDDYLAAHPGAEVISETALRELNASPGVRRTAVATDAALTVKVMGQDLKVDAAVPAELCGNVEANYGWPTRGKAKKVYDRITRTVKRRRGAFLWGMPGTGKDSSIHNISGLMRLPLVEVTFRPGDDISPLFYTRSMVDGNTGWEYGHVWKAITEGVKGRDGVSRPVIVLLSDVDRADEAQVEWFRILCDSMGGRIPAPGGRMVPLFPGTVFICTANSVGSGDSRGRMSSARAIDGSILDRLGRGIRAEYLDWEDERNVLMAKFPLVAEVAPAAFNATDPTDSRDKGPLGNAVIALRASIEAEDLYCEFTHRGICQVLLEMSDIIEDCREDGKAVPADLLKRGWSAWLEKLDDDTSDEARKLIDPHCHGGVVAV